MHTCPTCQESFDPSIDACPRCGADFQSNSIRIMLGEPPLLSDRYQLLDALSAGHYRVRDLRPHELPSEDAFIEPSPLALAYLQVNHPAIPHLLDRLHDEKREQLILEPRSNHEGKALPSAHGFWGYLGEDEHLSVLKDWLMLWTKLPPNYRKTATTLENAMIGDYRLLVRELLQGEASRQELVDCWHSLGLFGDPLQVWLERFAKGEMNENQLLDAISTLLSTPRIEWSHYAHTDTGKMREHNEDNYVAVTLSMHHSSLGQERHAEGGLYAVCDGMGGHESGEVASAIAAKVISEGIVPLACRDDLRSGELSHLLEEQIRQNVNEAILQENLARGIPDYKRMGCTLVLMLAAGKRAIAAHVGDSRLYYLSKDELHRLTQDHNIANWEFRMGRISEEKRDQLLRLGAGKALTQALGPRDRDDVIPEIQILDVEHEGIFLLCSDGLTDMVPDSLIHATVKAHWGDLEKAGKALVDMANAQGGADNITVILALAKPEPALFPKK